jgi:predicted nucleic-acid-binding protein
VLGVDTNVLVRFLADDDDTQSALTREFMADPGNQPIYLSMLVLSEAFTVLTKVRKFPMDAVHDGFRMLLRSPGFIVESPDLVDRAIEDGEAARCGFADALIALQHLACGCDVTVTFDHRATRLESMQRLEDYL